MSLLKLSSLSAVLAVAATGTFAAGLEDLPDPLELAQAADVCEGFVVGSARYVDDFTNLAITCTTTPAPEVVLDEDDELVGSIPLIGTLGPGGLAAISVGGLALVAGLTQEDDGGAPSDTQ